jgi:hypothetical protein
MEKFAIYLPILSEVERMSTLTACGNLEILKVEQHNGKLHITCSDKPFSFISFRPRQIKTKVVVYGGGLGIVLRVGKTSILF